MNLFLKFGKSIGLSDFILTQLYFFLLDYQRGSSGIGAPTSAVLEVGGAPPEELRYALSLRKTQFAADSAGYSKSCEGDANAGSKCRRFIGKAKHPKHRKRQFGSGFAELARLAQTAGKPRCLAMETLRAGYTFRARRSIMPRSWPARP